MPSKCSSTTCAPAARSRAEAVASAVIDGIATRYEVMGAGPPLLLYAPGGFDATVEKWTTQGVYAKLRFLDHLPKRYTCIAFDRRECGRSGGRVERVAWADYVAQGRGLLDHLGFDALWCASRRMRGVCGPSVETPRFARLLRMRLKKLSP